MLSLVNSTVQDISIKEDIGYEAIMGIIDRYIERDITWEDVTCFIGKYLSSLGKLDAIVAPEEGFETQL